MSEKLNVVLTLEEKYDVIYSRSLVHRQQLNEYAAFIIGDIIPQCMDLEGGPLRQLVELGGHLEFHRAFGKQGKLLDGPIILIEFDKRGLFSISMYEDDDEPILHRLHDMAKKLDPTVW